MIKIGLTGGIGTGKSTVSKILSAEGFRIIDADLVSRDVLEKNPRILDIIRTQFGSGFFDWRGEFRIKYEGIIIPYIKEEIETEFERYEKKGEKIVILDAPTLIENNLHLEMDYVILVVADNSVQIQRIISRDKLTKSDAVSRINSQMPVEQKKEFANILIDNNGDLIDTQKQVYDLIDFIKLIS